MRRFFIDFLLGQEYSYFVLFIFAGGCVGNPEIRSSLLTLARMGNDAQFAVKDLEAMICETDKLQKILKLELAELLFAQGRFEEVAKMCGIVLRSGKNQKASELLLRICRQEKNFSRRLAEFGVPNPEHVMSELFL